MTLSDLINKQTFLQTYLKVEPEYGRIVCAQFAEAGEIIQAIKWGMGDLDGWAWWPRAKMVKATRDELVSECIDLLHFILLEYTLDRGTVGDGQYIDEMYAMWWESASDPSSKTWDFWSAAEYFSSIPAHTHPNQKIADFVFGCLSLGLTKEDIHGGFQASFDKNVSRWVAAH